MKFKTLAIHSGHSFADHIGAVMTPNGGTFSFHLCGGQDAVFRLLERVQVFTLAESLGGVESLIEHPVTMTHLSVDHLDAVASPPKLAGGGMGPRTECRLLGGSYLRQR